MVDDQTFSALTLVNRYGHEMDGEDLGLLLYEGGTVCEKYNLLQREADAICRAMNYTSANNWTKAVEAKGDWGYIPDNYLMKVYDVSCNFFEKRRCILEYNIRNDYYRCRPGDVLFLSCNNDNRKFFRFERTIKHEHLIKAMVVSDKL